MGGQWFALMRVLAVKPEDLGKLATKPPHVLVPMWTTIAEDEDGSGHACADGQFTIPVARLSPWNPREDRPVTREEAIAIWNLRRSWNRVLAAVPERGVLHGRAAPCPQTEAQRLSAEVARLEKQVADLTGRLERQARSMATAEAALAACNREWAAAWGSAHADSIPADLARWCAEVSRQRAESGRAIDRLEAENVTLRKVVAQRSAAPDAALLDAARGVRDRMLSVRFSLTREDRAACDRLNAAVERCAVLAMIPASNTRRITGWAHEEYPAPHGRAGIAADTDAAKRLAAAESAALDGAWRMISAAGWTPDRFRLEHHVGEPRRTLLVLRAGPGAPVDAPLFEVVVNAPLFDATGPAVRVTSRWLAAIPRAPGAAGPFTVTGTIDGEPRTYTVAITTTHGRVTRPWSTAQLAALGLDAAAPAHAGDFRVELEERLAAAGYGIASYRVSGLAHALEVYRNR